MAEQIKIIDKRRLINFIDKLPKKYIKSVNNALEIAIDLPERRIWMKKNIRNKEYTMEEAVAYYILGFKRYNNDKQKKGLKDIKKGIRNSKRKY